VSRALHQFVVSILAGALALAACGGGSPPTVVPATPNVATPGGSGFTATLVASTTPGSTPVTAPLVPSVVAASSSVPPAPPTAVSVGSTSATVVPTATPTVMLTPTTMLTAAPTAGDDTPPTTTAGCDLAVNIGLLETIPGTYQVTAGVSSVGGANCPSPVTLSLSVTPSGALTLGSLVVAYEYNGSAIWSCSGTTCTASAAVPANPPGTMYQVGFQTMATLSGTAQLCATVTSSAETNTANDTWCEALP